MTNQELTELFTEHVVEPLTAVGFTTRGKSLYFADAHKHVALIRGGGRLAEPGAIIHVLGLRLAFLRDTSSTLAVSDNAPRGSNAYPFLLAPNQLPLTSPQQWKFNPSLHYTNPWGQIH